ncbi:MAG: hypothetical protein ACRCYO_07310 [Bacteroidia bacterium]
MKKISTLLFLVFASSLALHAQFGLPPGFNVKEFQKNEQLAIWFINYDSIWHKVTAFDREAANAAAHICMADKKEGWRIVTGTPDSSGIWGGKVYAADSKGRIEQKKKADTAQIASLGKALYNANQQLAKLNVKNMTWRKFVRLNEDLSITIWAFCDNDANGTIWYGPECTWYYAPNGQTLLSSKIINRSPMAAGKTARGLNLSCPADKMPSVGTIWLALRWRNVHSEINVAYKTGTSTLYFNKAENTISWEHLAN